MLSIPDLSGICKRGWVLLSAETLTPIRSNDSARAFLKQICEEGELEVDELKEILGLTESRLASGKSWENSVLLADGSRLNLNVELDRLELVGKEFLLLTLQDRRAFHRLETAARNLSDALDAAEDFIALLDPDSLRFVEVNRGAVRSVGYLGKELLEMTPLELNPQITMEEYRRSFIDPLIEGQRTNVRAESVHRKKDGTAFPVEILLQSFTERDDMGLLLYVARDISELERSQQDQRRFFRLSLEMLCVANKSGYFVRVNPFFCRTLGYSEEQMTSRPFTHFVHPDDLEATREASQKLFSGRRIVGFENRYRKVDGTFCHLYWTASYDEESGQIFAAARDVTAERRREEELAETNLRLERVARADRAARRTLLAFDQLRSTEETLKTVLQVISEEYGLQPLAVYQLDEWKGELELSASLALPKDESQSFKLGEGLVGEAALSKNPIIIQPESDQLVLQTGLGTIRPQTLFAFPFVHLERVLGVLTGASLSVLREDELSALEQLASLAAISLNASMQFRQMQQLSRQLTQKSRRISLQNQELLRASRHKSEFLANMSHELRTPLNAIIGFSECLCDGLLGDLTADQSDYIREIFGSGQHLLSLINDILDLSKIEAGMMELILEQVDVMPLLRNSLLIIKEPASKKELKVLADFSDELEPIWADARKLRQITYNLLSNAVKFTEPGGKITLRALREGDDLCVSVVDTGIGIAQEDQERLFEPFVQLDSDLSRKYEGTGLGLGLVKRLVELHEGTIEVVSTPGEGTSIQVKLPYRTEEAARAFSAAGKSTSISESNLQASPEVIQLLLITTEPEILSTLRKTLSTTYCTIHSAASYEDAFQVIQSSSLDVILLDVPTTEVAEEALIEKIRSLPECDDIPVILLCSDDLDRRIVNGLKILELLQKPISSEQLVSTLNKVGIYLRDAPAPRVLVVDDDPRAVEYIARILEGRNCPVYRAFGGQDALQVLAQNEIDLIILDLMMPEVDGQEVLREIRGNPDYSKIPVVILTAKTLTLEERVSLRDSTFMVLEKPLCTDEDLISAVHRGMANQSRGER